MTFKIKDKDLNLMTNSQKNSKKFLFYNYLYKNYVDLEHCQCQEINKYHKGTLWKEKLLKRNLFHKKYSQRLVFKKVCFKILRILDMENVWYFSLFIPLKKCEKNRYT